MKNAIRAVLSAIGLMLKSDHERFRFSCVEFCDEHANADAVVATSDQHFRGSVIAGNVLVVGDRVTFSGVSMAGTVVVAPWAHKTTVIGSAFWQGGIRT